MSLTYPEAVVVGALQGVTELFPVSSLGHSVLLPALVGGRWAADLDVSAPESPYLAFIVGLHVATALALLVFFWRDWVRIVGGFVSLDPVPAGATTEASGWRWLLVLATIPVGLAGLLLEHLFRTTLGRPVPAAAFLIVNGCILLVGERLRRRRRPRAGRPVAADARCGRRATRGDPARGRRPAAAGRSPPQLPRRVLIGASQILALLPGISRSGVAMVAGLTRGLSHEDAARFSFLLATPVILAAGVLKLPGPGRAAGRRHPRPGAGRQRRLVRRRLRCRCAC